MARRPSGGSTGGDPPGRRTAPTPRATTAGSDGDRPRRSVGAWRAAPVLFVVFTAAHWAMAVHMRAPIIHADEFGYLQNARFLARGGPRPSIGYSPGYSLLLVPLWWLSDNAATVYHGALAVNSLLSGVTVVLLWALARRLAPAAGPAAWAGAAVAVGAYPSLVLASELATSENLLIPGILLVCLLVERAVRRPTTARWAAAALAGGLLYLVHERAIAVSAAVVLTAAWSLRPWRENGPVIGAVVSVTAATLVFCEGITAWVIRPVPGQHLTIHQVTALHVATHTLSARGLADAGSSASGQLLTVLVGSAGLLSLGVAALWASRPGRAARPFLHPVVAAFLAVAFAALVVVSALAMESGPRLDHHVYGRYLDVMAVPLFVVGALAGSGLSRRRPPVRARAVLAATAVALAVCGFGVAWRIGAVSHGEIATTNVFGLNGVFWLDVSSLHLTAWHTLNLPLVAGLGLLAAAAVILAYRVAPAAGLAATLIAFLPGSVLGYAHLVPESQFVATRQVVPTVLRAVQSVGPPVSCVGWDLRSSPTHDWDFFNTRLFDAGHPFEVFDARRGQQPCSPIVVSVAGLSSLPAYQGAKLLLADNEGLDVWVLAGSLQDRLQQAGWLPAEGLPGPLPRAAQDGSVRLEGRAGPDLTVPAGATRSVQLRVTHTGVGVWPSLSSLGPAAAQGFSQGSVRVALRWYPPGDASTMIGPEGRADLNVSLPAAGSQTVAAVLDPASSHAGPGHYDVRLTLVQEGDQQLAGVPPLTLHVTVAG